MRIDGRNALVTGANRGLGRHLAEQLRDRGAEVYGAARNPDAIALDRSPRSPSTSPTPTRSPMPRSTSARSRPWSTTRAPRAASRSSTARPRTSLGIEAIEAGDFEVIADDVTRQVLGGLSAGVGALYPDLAPASA